MPIPTPSSNEDRQKFIGRCMSNEVMKKEFPDMKQRSAVCFSKWKRKELKKLMFKDANIY